MTFEPCENIISRKIDEFEVKGKTAEVWIVKGKLQIRCLGVIHNIPLSLVTPQPCEDAISRQEAILQVQRYGVGCFDAEEFSPEQCERFVIQKLNELPLVMSKEKMGWIPVSERLPESEGYGHNFLCCLENGVIRILGYSNILTTRCPKGFYYEKENGTTWRQDINPVIAWMPLPESYKEESK